MKHIESFDKYQICQDSSAESGHQFYALMGRFFASASIRRELGGPMSDDANHVWLMAYEKGGEEIVAFSGVRFNADRTVATFTETWVAPEHRNNGLFDRLFTLKYDLCAASGARVVKGMANAASAAAFERHGWQATAVRGSWTHYEKRVQTAAPVEAQGVALCS